MQNQGQLGVMSSGILTYDQTLKIADNVVSAEAAGNCTFFVTDNNELYGCGSNEFGVLGLGEATSLQQTPVIIDSNVIRAYCSGTRTSYVKNDGSLWLMGKTKWGGPSIFTPEQTETGVSDVTTDYFSRTDGSVWEMGDALGFVNGDASRRYEESTVVTSLNVPVLVEPLSDQYLTGSNYTFRWEDGVGVDAYEVWAGTTVGGNDLYQSGSLSGDIRSLEGTSLPRDGNTVYFRLRWSIDGTWYSYGATAKAGLTLTPKANSLTSSWDHTLVVKPDGSLWAGGGNAYG